MAANNPHLQKKRSSKKGLRRSLMRRITEIPESMSQQGSKEEKDGSVGGGSVSRSGSYKRRHLDAGSSSVKLKDDSSSKPKVASSLKKSHSTYDHTRDTKENNLPVRHESYKEASLLDSMMRKKLAKKVSERSNSDSLDDSAPLVYKSVSAHNLMAERKPLHPKPSPLQKSLSAVTSAKEKGLLLTSRAYLEDNSKLAQDKEKKGAIENSTTESDVSGHTEVTDIISKAAVKDLQTDDTSERTTSCLFEDDSSNKDTVCPSENGTAPSTPSENRSQKNVIYAPIRSVSINISELPGRRHQASKKMPPEPPIRQQSLVHSLERKDATLWEAQEQTHTFSQSLKREAKDSPMLVNVCPSEMEESEKKTEIQRDRQKEDKVQPSSSAGLTRLASIAAEVCPWEVMEVPIPKKKDPEVSESDSQKSSPEKQSPSPQFPIPRGSMKSLGLAIKAFNRSRIKASIRARKDEEESPKKNGRETSEKNEKLQTAEGTLMSAGGSPRQQVMSRSLKESRSEIVSKQSIITPWAEEEEALSSSPKKSPKKVLEVCPWEANEDSLTQGRASSTEATPSTCADEISPNRLDRIKSQRESVCPWETIDDDQTRGEEISNISPMVLKAENKAETCPWELAEVTPSTRNEAQEKTSGLHDFKDIKKLSLGTDIKKSPDDYKAEENKSRSVESHKFRPTISEEVSTSIKTEVCPWEAEKPLSKEKTPVEDNEGSFKDKTTIPRVAAIKTDQDDTVCPWETMELPERINTKTTLSQRGSDNKADIKTAVCPWETSDTPPEEPREESREDSKGIGGSKLRGPFSEKTKDRESIPRDSVCPWENVGSEESSTKPTGKILELSKVVLKKSSSGDSKKVQVCPWETKTAEVCPWEVVSSALEEKMEGGPSRGMTTRKPLEDSMQRESVCPWEDTEAEASLLEPSAEPLKLSKASCDSFQNKKAEIAPWEIQEAEIDIKTAVCPWESDDAPMLKREFKKNASSVSKDGKRETVCPWESTEDKDVLIKPKSQSSYVSTDTSKKPESFESLKTAVCPWETEGIEVSAKAGISPWNAIPAPSDKRSPTQDAGGASTATGDIVSKPPEKTSNSRETICPWETMDIDDPSSRPSAKRPILSKVGTKKSSSADSLKAEVCPWESQEVEPSIKADVRPWESPESPTGKRLSFRTAGTFERSTPQKQAVHFKTTEKILSPRESLCPWETMDTEKSLSEPSAKNLGMFKVSSKRPGSSDTLKTEVCPWESQEAVCSTKADVCPWEVSERSLDKRPSLKRAEALERSKSTSLEQTVEKISSPRESVCPWDNVNPSEFSPKPEPYKITSKKSDSAESLKAEVCPWEVVEESVLRKDDDSRSSSPMRISKAMERLSRSREDICPWESMELEGPSARSAGQSPALSKAGSKKSDSAESLRAEICPWEFMEEEEVTTKADMYPWTAAMAPFGKGKLKQDPAGTLKGKRGQISIGTPDSKKTGGEPSFKKIEKSKSHQESASVWKSMEFDKPPAKSTRSLDLLQVSSKKSESVESLKAEVCPWEFQEIPTHAKAEICPSEVTEGPPERETFKSYQSKVSSDETSTKPIVRTLKTEERGGSQQESVSSSESVELSQSQKSSLPEGGSKKSISVESLRAEVCPWETEEEESSGKVEMYSQKTAQDPFNEGSLRQNISQGKAQLSPGMIKDGGQTGSRRIEKTCSHPVLASPQKGTDELSVKPSSKSLDLPKVISVKSDNVESLKAEICPWEIQGTGATTKAEVCPWEVADAPPNRETPSKEGAAISKGDMKVASKSPVERMEKDCSSKENTAAEVPVSNTSASPPSQKTDSSKTRKMEICPWETDQLEKEEICPWEAGMVLPTKDETPTTKASAAELPEVSVKRSQSKQQALPGHKPLCRSLPGTTLHIDLSKGSSSVVDILEKRRHDSTVADICPWEAEENLTSARKDSAGISKALPEVCPWEAEGTSPTSVIPTKSKEEKSQADKTQDPHRAKSDICPWDCD